MDFNDFSSFFTLYFQFFFLYFTWKNVWVVLAFSLCYNIHVPSGTISKERTGKNEAKQILETKTKAIRRFYIGAPYGYIYYIYIRNTHVGGTRGGISTQRCHRGDTDNA